MIRLYIFKLEHLIDLTVTIFDILVFFDGIKLLIIFTMFPASRRGIWWHRVKMNDHQEILIYLQERINHSHSYKNSDSSTFE